MSESVGDTSEVSTDELTDTLICIVQFERYKKAKFNQAQRAKTFNQKLEG